jgi:3-oxoacyl-[acyl-carrier protein] reductase
MRLKDKKIIVTGGGSGFGAEMCRRFTAEGARVLVADINGGAAEKIAREIGAAAVPFTADVSQKASVDAMVAAAIAKFGDLDCVVNNAGYTHSNRPALEVDEATFDRVYAVNVKSIYLSTLAAVPHFRKRGGGCFLNIGSTAGIRPRPGLTWYNGSKAAANLLSKSLAVELAPDRIRVNALCPVIGNTGMLEQFMGMPDTPENRAKFIATIPLGRMSEPKDVANAAVFLVSDEAEFLTGVCLPVDGGRTI